MIEQGKYHGPRGAQPGGKPSLASQSDRRLFDDEIPQIEGVAQAGKADDEKQIDLSRGRQKRASHHADVVVRSPP
jgi:hypothetical protein